MRITIRQLNLINFKGVKQLSVSFKDVTNISGQNATGKTTIFDAFTWLLFGKDSTDKKDFNIKTLDKDNNPIHRLDHEVSAIFDVDNTSVTFRRVYREKWIKQRGAETAEFSGHETLYYWNDVPKKQSEFDILVGIMLSESIAKLITNPMYFNTMKWADRRTTLSKMAGEISDTDIADGYPEFMELLDRLNGKSLIELKKQISSTKTKIKNDLDQIPGRIDEIVRSMPEPKDYPAIEKRIAVYEKELSDIDDLIADRSKQYETSYQTIGKIQEQKHKLSTAYRAEENTIHTTKQNAIQHITNEINRIERLLRSLKEDAQRCVNHIDKHAVRIMEINEQMEGLRKDWAAENEKVFVMDPHKLVCPTCKRDLDADNQTEITETLQTNFNNEKQKQLSIISKNGLAKKVEAELEEKNKEDARREWTAKNIEIEKAKSDLEKLQIDKLDAENANIEPSDEMNRLKAEIDAIVMPDAPILDASDLKSQKNEINGKITIERLNLSEKATAEKQALRKKEVEDQERDLSQQLAGLEKQEFTIDAFNKKRIETIEQRINGMFKIVRFKMFEQQLNGGEIECCECLVNGVPFSDVNTAGKINAGIDIINALCKFYRIYAPIWIDNRESVNDIIDSNSQIINLIVSKEPTLNIR
jgi:exonuclease SbcC